MYNIKIYNGSNVLVYNEDIEAMDRNEAIEKMLKELTIYPDDRIIIE